MFCNFLIFVLCSPSIWTCPILNIKHFFSFLFCMQAQWKKSKQVFKIQHSQINYWQLVKNISMFLKLDALKRLIFQMGFLILDHCVPFLVGNQLLIAGDICGSRVFSIFELEKSPPLLGSCRTWIRHHPDWKIIMFFCY